VLGLVYAIFLPFIGIAMTIALLARKAAEGGAHAASFSWRPVEAYLAGRKSRKAAKGEKKHGDN
jgi:hypothetical protein